MKIMCLKQIVVTLLMVGMIETLLAKEAPVSVELKGRALFSFTPDHFMLQTDKYIYKISKGGLSQLQRGTLDQASAQGQTVTMNVPQAAIEYLWPNEPYRPQKQIAKKYIKFASQLSSVAKRHKGQILLRGNSEFSFSEAFFLVQVGQEIYQVRKSKLDPSQLESFTNIGIGGRVNVSVPKKAVELAWSFKQDPSRKVASVEIQDEVKIEDNSIAIRGTVLYSFDEPMVLVESKNTIFQIKKDRILSVAAKAFDSVGSKVQFSVPIDAIQFAWTTEPGSMRFERFPASTP